MSQVLQGEVTLKFLKVPEPTAALGAQYWLGEGETFKFLPPPSSAARRKFCMDYSLIGGEASNLVFIWQKDKLYLDGFTQSANGMELESVLTGVVGVSAKHLAGDKRLLGVSVPGDFVVASDHDDEELLPLLEEALRRVNVHVSLRFESQQKQVFVATGKYTVKPKDLVNNPLKICSERIFEASPGGGAGSPRDFLERVSVRIGFLIIDQTDEPPEGTFEWRYNVSEVGRSNPDLILRNITAQTGIQFRWELRPIRFLVVHAAN